MNTDSEKPIKDLNIAEAIEESLSRAYLIALITEQLRISTMMEARHPFGIRH